MVSTHTCTHSCTHALMHICTHACIHSLLCELGQGAFSGSWDALSNVPERQMHLGRLRRPFPLRVGQGFQPWLFSSFSGLHSAELLWISSFPRLPGSFSPYSLSTQQYSLCRIMSCLWLSYSNSFSSHTEQNPVALLWPKRSLKNLALAPCL